MQLTLASGLGYVCVISQRVLATSVFNVTKSERKDAGSAKFS